MSDYKIRHIKAKREGRKEWNHPGNDSYILVLNYDMELIKSFKSDCDIANLTVTSDPSIIYVTDLRENRLIKYKLDGLN